MRRLALIESIRVAVWVSLTSIKPDVLLYQVSKIFLTIGTGPEGRLGRGQMDGRDGNRNGRSE